jgi:hypothetical protein
LARPYRRPLQPPGLVESLSVVCSLATVLFGCAAPVPVREGGGIAATSAGAEPSSRFGPRFATGGPDAAAYGGTHGYPIGGRLSFADRPVIVGSFSQAAAQAGH